MSVNKRRKLDSTSDAPQLSAFAARRNLQNNTKSRIQVTNSPSQDFKDAPFVSIPISTVQDNTSNPDVQDAFLVEKSPALHTAQSTAAMRYFEDDKDDQNSSFHTVVESPELLLERPSITLSTFKPTRENARELDDSKLSLMIAPGERLVALGSYDISVQKGQITLLGATLQASSRRYRVYAPSSYSLPIIRCLVTNVDNAEICLHQCEGGLGHLKSLSPYFSKLWNEGSGPFNPDYKAFTKLKESSFQILHSSSDGPRKVYLHPLVSPPEWNEMLSNLSTADDQKTPRIMICGPKSSGKSTFAKLLANRFLMGATPTTRLHSSTSRTSPGVALLDLDPGQPEYSVPGQISLIHIQEPNFGPPFSHPIPDNKSRIVRAHTVGAITPSLDPSFYMACALDLFFHYRNVFSPAPSCPLVINTPGWVLGTGLEILVDLIFKVRPTEVIYMSQEGPSEVVESLRDAAKSTPLLTLPSQVSDYTTRTAAHLRALQILSYFHLDPSSKTELAWDTQPLTSMPPWEIRYSGEGAGILGIMCYGEQPPPHLLLDLINGSLVAIVVIDDLAAIPGWQDEGQDPMGEEEQSEFVHPFSANTGDAELRTVDDESQRTRHLERPLITRTPKEDLPYFNPANATCLDPKHSHCIGFALIRGIDITRRRLQVLTPISPRLIKESNEMGKSIVLVSGKFENPGWAYTESLIQNSTTDKNCKSQKDADVEVDEADEDKEQNAGYGRGVRALVGGFQNAPWVQRLEGSQGRGVGSRVWRVRRDLGKSGDGGD